jgi:hypothetical protein
MLPGVHQQALERLQQSCDLARDPLARLGRKDRQI